jgi:hypothetical protein
MLLPFIRKTMDETAPGLLDPAILPPNQLPCDLPSRCSARNLSTLFLASIPVIDNNKFCDPSLSFSPFLGGLC